MERGSFSRKNYHDPPTAPLIDGVEITKWTFYRVQATLLFLYVEIVLTVIGYRLQFDGVGNMDVDAGGGVGILGVA